MGTTVDDVVSKTSGDDETVRAAPDAMLRDAAGLFAAGERVEVTDAVVGAAAAGQMEADETLIVVGVIGSLSGNARVLMDVPAALAFGAACGLVFALVTRILGRGGSS